MPTTSATMTREKPSSMTTATAATASAHAASTHQIAAAYVSKCRRVRIEYERASASHSHAAFTRAFRCAPASRLLLLLDADARAPVAACMLLVRLAQLTMMSPRPRFNRYIVRVIYAMLSSGVQHTFTDCSVTFSIVSTARQGIASTRHRHCESRVGVRRRATSDSAANPPTAP